MTTDDELIEAMRDAWLDSGYMRAVLAAVRARDRDGELQRYGIEWTGPETPISVLKDDGYWTPWHVAEAKLAVVRAHDRDGERRESALHLAVMSAVSQLNLSAPAATCAFARDARDTLRQALIDYADAAMRAER